MEILYIPIEVLDKMALWLSQQQNEDGAFIETAENYYDRNFWVNTLCHVLSFFFSKSCLDFLSMNAVDLKSFEEQLNAVSIFLNV